MQPDTANKLNQLNLNFYKTTAEYFDDSRQFFWKGWENLLPDLRSTAEKQNILKVLDLGCGNGRFGQFLCEKLTGDFEYLGIDNSSDLLKIARSSFVSVENEKCKVQFAKKDLVKILMNGDVLKNTLKKDFNLIALFGVWHHIPSADLRQKLLSQATEILLPGGTLVITIWKFAEYERFRKKTVNPELAGINSSALEEGDFILDWKRGENAYRYCHYSSANEIKSVVESISSLNLTSFFRADGKEGDVNQYLILQKSVQ